MELWVLTASILRIYITWERTIIKLPDVDIGMSKHVAVCIVYKNTIVEYTVVILIVHLLVVIKTIKNKTTLHLLKKVQGCW